MSWKTITIGLSTAFLVATLTAGGQPPEPEDAEPPRGAVLYRLYCASCHGVEGRGDGPVASELKSRPPDLTRIAVRRRGRFSTSEIARIIDGRTEVEVHGRRDMPVWGLSLHDPGRLGDQEEEIWLQIRHLVRHLRSLQTGKVVDVD